MSECPFCQILSGDAPAQIVRRAVNSLTIVPLDPIVPGHRIVIPYAHVDRADYDPHVTAQAFGDAATYAQTHNIGDHNLIVNCGRAASQTVRHLHVHVIPRSMGDGLKLPWTDQRKPTP